MKQNFNKNPMISKQIGILLLLTYNFVRFSAEILVEHPKTSWNVIKSVISEVHLRISARKKLVRDKSEKFKSTSLLVNTDLLHNAGAPHQVTNRVPCAEAISSVFIKKKQSGNTYVLDNWKTWSFVTHYVSHRKMIWELLKNKSFHYTLQ